MNRPDQRFQDLFHGDPYYEQDYHQDYREPYWESFTQPGFVITLLLGLVGVVYHIFRLLDYDLLPLPELMWNVLVYLTPCRLLEFVETYTDPLRNPGIGKRRWNHSAKSQAMRQIIGLDAPGGIISTVAQAGRRRLSSISGISMVAQAGEGQPAGLGNWDNSCYQNSVLQGLATLDPLTEYLTRPQIDEKLFDEETKPDMEMAEALRELIETLKDPSNNGRRVWTPAALKNMSSWQQQDAQEYFSKVLDEIDKEVAKAAKSIKKYPGLESQQKSTLSLSNPPPMSTFRNPLEGLIAQRVGCTKCGYSEGLSMIPFNCLTVPLGKAWEHDISECLDEYTKLEPIEGVECGKCTLLKHQRLLSTILERVKDSPEDNPVRVQTTERLEAVNLALEEDDYEDKTLLQKCKISAKNRVSTTKSRQAVVARPPKSLVVHFNRSLFDEMTGELRKNHSQVRFPKVLDLGPWCLGSSGKSSTAAMEEWLLNPEQSMIASTEKSSRLHGPLYELRAVVTHYGRHENGHYICYKKHPKTAVDEKGSVDEDWWRLSDDEVSKVSEENVLSQGGVFMLFFDCIEPAITVLQTAEQPQPTIVPELIAHVETVQAAEVSSPEPAHNNKEANGPSAPSDSLRMLPLTTMTRMHTDEESIAASVSDDEDPSEKEQEQQDYEPTKAIVLPKYVPTPGVENEEPGQKEIRPPVRFVMV